MISRTRLSIQTARIASALLISSCAISTTTAKTLPTASELIFQPGANTPTISSAAITLHPNSILETRNDEVREIILEDGTVLSLGPNTRIIKKSGNPDLDKIISFELLQGSLKVTTGLQHKKIGVIINSVEANISNAAALFHLDTDQNLQTALIYGQSVKLKGAKAKQNLRLRKSGYGAIIKQNQLAGTASTFAKPIKLSTIALTRLLNTVSTAQLAKTSDEDSQHSGRTEPNHRDAKPTETEQGQANATLQTDSPATESASSDSTTSETTSSPAVVWQPSDVATETTATVAPPALPNDNLNDLQSSEVAVVPDRNVTTETTPSPQALLQVVSGTGQDVSQNDFQYRDAGRTTNRFYDFGEGGNQPFSFPFGADLNNLDDFVPPTSNAPTYLIQNDGQTNLYFGEAANLYLDVLPNDSTPLIFSDINFPESGQIISDAQNTTLFPMSYAPLPNHLSLAAQNNSLVSTDLRLLTAGFSEWQRAPDNFLLLHAQPNDPNNASTENYFFATGDVDGRLPENGFSGSEFSVDQFYLSSSLPQCNGCAPTSDGTIAPDIRAFAPINTSLNLNLEDSGLLIVNPSQSAVQSSQETQIAAFHVDFGYSGEGAEQRSTISTTIGHVQYDISAFSCNTDCNVPTENAQSVQTSFEAATIGSSQGPTLQGGAPEQGDNLYFESEFRATAAGGGNPALDKQGYLGYLILENFDPYPQHSVDHPLKGGYVAQDNGIESDSTLAEQYALLRLGTATGEVTTGDRISHNNLNGWAAGFARSDENIADDLTSLSDAEHIKEITSLLSDANPEGFILSTDAETNRVGATFQFPHMNSELHVGGLEGEESLGASAYIDEHRFGARTPDSTSLTNLAIISSGMVIDGLPELEANKIPDYDHVKWGFFFGQVFEGLVQREHVHLGSWVAGEAADPASFPSTGSALYAGHVFANVVNNGDRYNAIGTLDLVFRFSHRVGSTLIEFDGHAYSGPIQLLDNSAQFNGALTASNLTDSFTGSLNGNLVQGGGDPIQAVIGQVNIESTDPNLDYRAVGTFAGQRVPRPVPTD